MKKYYQFLRATSFIGSSFLVSIILVNPARAFHSGGIGDCSGCHSTHSANIQSSESGTLNSAMLLGSDPGSTCLNCHQKSGEKRPASYLVSTSDSDLSPGFPPIQSTPGGDFGWLKKNYVWRPEIGENGGNSPGEGHGHNIVASDYRFIQDTTRVTAPGESYPANRLSCISCHDPHGKYRRFPNGSIGTEGAPIQASGSYDSSPDPTDDLVVGVYRLLGGKGYKTSLHDGVPFSEDPPAAVSPTEYNRSEESSDTRVAYGSGMSEWCANCHPAFIGHGTKVHPSGNSIKLTTVIVANYNAYVASGNLSGSSSTSYTSMVPFEAGTSDYGLLKRMAKSDGSSGAGPGPQANVMCLSCHRAHASGWDHGARWNMKVDTLVYNGQFPGTDDSTMPANISQGRTRSETRKAFYDRPPTAYATYQRSLCNKCHAKD